MFPFGFGGFLRSNPNSVLYFWWTGSCPTGSATLNEYFVMKSYFTQRILTIFSLCQMRYFLKIKIMQKYFIIFTSNFIHFKICYDFYSNLQDLYKKNEFNQAYSTILFIIKVSEHIFIYYLMYFHCSGFIWFLVALFLFLSHTLDGIDGKQVLFIHCSSEHCRHLAALQTFT